LGLFVVLVVTGVVGGAALPRAWAAPAGAPPAAPPAAPPGQGVSNDTCLACHQKPDLSMKLADGETLSLYVSPDDYNHAVHGSQGYACVQCHTTIRAFPHPAFTAQDRRDVTLQLYPSCKVCHPGQYEKTLDSAHDRARAAGDRQAAVCSDCHSAHATRRLTDPATHQLLPETRTWVPTTCAQCHSAIYDKYKTSVHGAALTDEKNMDVPTCTDCHGVHNISNPTTNAFRLASPQICAGCHTDKARMDKYHLSTNVLSTYVSDFHGTTVTLFEKQSPDAPTNKAVCYDCHGVHDIVKVDDPQRGLLIRQNLLARCQVCHPTITANFPDSWLSHYIPSRQEHPLIYYVNVFYSIFIPTVLGSMAVLVVLDLFWRVRRKLLKPRAAQGPSPWQLRLAHALDAIAKKDPTKVLAKFIHQLDVAEEREVSHD
jgi:predicted CXXCH cytochrome family protein